MATKRLVRVRALYPFFQNLLLIKLSLGLSTGYDGLDAASSSARLLHISPSYGGYPAAYSPTAVAAYPAPWNKVSAIKDQLRDSVSHCGKAHGRDHSAGTKHGTVTGWPGTDRVERQKGPGSNDMPSPVPRMTCFWWITHEIWCHFSAMCGDTSPVQYRVRTSKVLVWSAIVRSRQW